LDITRFNNSFFIQRWVFHSSADSTSNCVISVNMAKLSFIALTIFLSIFNNLLSSYALYGSSSPVLQLTPSNFKSKVNFRFCFSNGYCVKLINFASFYLKSIWVFCILIDDISVLICLILSILGFVEI
jgi:hypothetical protein